MVQPSLVKRLNKDFETYLDLPLDFPRTEKKQIKIQPTQPT